MTYDPKEYFARRARQQGKYYVAKGGRPEAWERERQAITPYLRTLVTGKRVLDYGCGPGRFRAVLSEQGREYTGFDLLDRFSTSAVIPTAYYDTVVAVFVLQHIVDDEQYNDAVQTIYHALVPRGRFVVVDCIERPGLDAHMRPRGMAGLLMAGLWGSAHHVGSYEGHWIGWLERGVEP